MPLRHSPAGLRPRWPRSLALLAAALCLGAAAARAPAQTSAPPAQDTKVDEAYLREHYTKYEHRIPMRDGVRLLTSVYIPKEDAEAYPILLTRTPYGVKPYSVDRYPEPGGPLFHYAKERFIFALQDVRGRNGSEGTFIHMRPHRPGKSGPQDVDESTDAYDTIDWLVQNIPKNNGRVGMMGISYPGFYTAAGMIDSHPALKCASPQAPIADWFIGDDFHHNGAFYLAHAFGFLSRFGQRLENPTREQAKPFDYRTPDGYRFFLEMGPLANADRLHFRGEIAFWDELMRHGDYDAFWQERNLLPHLANVRTAVLTVGGWFDAEDLYGPLGIYREVERRNPGIFNALVIGPWAHGDWSRQDGDQLGHVRFHARTAAFYREQIELPFLKHFLEDSADTPPAFPEAWVFETGACQWRRHDTWPPAASEERQLYLHPGGRLAFHPPPGAEPPFDSYISDPAKPVPYIPGIAAGMTKEHMVDDQRFAASRPDVLVYESEVLEEDLTLAGPLAAHLQVSTTGTDADWVIKLIDVYSGDHPNPEPNPAGVQMGGYQQLVRGEAFRGKYRNSFSHPEPFRPGEVTAVDYVLPDVYHTFRRGHRLMVQVQSSWFPLVDRNPQTFCDIYQARPEDFRAATQRVYRAPVAASHLTVRVLASP